MIWLIRDIEYYLINNEHWGDWARSEYVPDGEDRGGVGEQQDSPDLLLSVDSLRGNIYHLFSGTVFG